MQLNFLLSLGIGIKASQEFGCLAKWRPSSLWAIGSIIKLFFLLKKTFSLFLSDISLESAIHNFLVRGKRKAFYKTEKEKRTWSCFSVWTNTTAEGLRSFSVLKLEDVWNHSWERLVLWQRYRTYLQSNQNTPVVYFSGLGELGKKKRWPTLTFLTNYYSYLPVNKIMWSFQRWRL